MGPRDSTVRQSTMPLMGQCEAIVQMVRTCNGPIRGLVPPFNRILCWPTRLSRTAVRHVLDGPMRSNGPNGTFTQWAHTRGVAPANSILCWPAREFRTAACHVFDGPVRFNCPNVTYMHGPARWSRVASTIFLVGQCEPKVQMLRSFNGPT